MRFNSWPFLFLLFVIPLLHRWWKRRNQPPSVSFSLPTHASASTWDPSLFFIFLRYLGYALLIVALARPQSSFKKFDRSSGGIDIMMVMDVSASMLIEDLGNRPRLEIAKETIENFIKGRQSDRIGFNVFSGEPLTLVPPTLDYGLLLKSLKEAEAGVLKDGTAIGDGLALAVNRLKNSYAKSRIIILLTDGDNNVGQVDPATAGDLAAGFGIRVYTIAIGREGRVLLPIRQKGPFGNTITRYQPFENALNPELLQFIATQTKGKFYRVTEEKALESVFNEINQLEKNEILSTEKVRYEDQYQKPLLIGILLLLLEQILTRGVLRVLP
jgi:Ca-activated chloride channel homolog